MFGALRVAKARTLCTQTLQQIITPSPLRPPWPPEFWHDPFVVGLVMFAIATLGNLATGGKLTQEQRLRVFSGTLEDLGGNPADFIERVDALTVVRHPDFYLGSRNAETIIAYAFNLHPMPDDADVARATEMAKGSTRTGEASRDDICGSLMYLLFTWVVQGRLGAPDRVADMARQIHEVCCTAHDFHTTSGTLLHKHFANHPMLKSHRAPTPTEIDQVHTFWLSDGRQGFGVMVCDGQRDKKAWVAVAPDGDFGGAHVQSVRKGRYIVSVERSLARPQGRLATKLIDTFVVTYDAANASF